RTRTLIDSWWLQAIERLGTDIPAYRWAQRIREATGSACTEDDVRAAGRLLGVTWPRVRKADRALRIPLVDALAHVPEVGAVSGRAVARGLDVDPKTALKRLRMLADRGLVREVDRGWQRTPAAVALVAK